MHACLTVAALLCAALPACAAPVAQKVLTVCTEGAPTAFNPMLGANGTTFDANRPIYNRLVQFRPGTTTPAPALATAWDVSAGGLTYTFHLRHNVTWQSNEDFRPSHPLDSADVAFSFARQLQDSNPFHTVSGGTYVYFGYMGIGGLLADVETPDAQTVRFTLKHAYAPFLADLAMDFAAIQSKEYADTLARLGRPEQIDRRPIGTGPFQLTAYDDGTSIRYQSFARYWGGKPKLDALVFAITPEAAARAQKLHAGTCQVALFPSLVDLPALRSDPHVQVLSGPVLDVGFIAFNTTHKPLDDPRVRTALSMAVDRRAIVASVYQDAGLVAHGLLPPSVIGGDTGSLDVRYDPAAAKRMLAAAGLKDGFATDLWAMPVQRPYDPNGKQVAEMVQADLAKVGVKTSIASDAWDDYRRRAMAGEPSLVELGWIGDNGDPDNFLTPLVGCAAAAAGGSNVARWCDKDFDALLAKAVTTSDAGTRGRLYQQAQAILRKQLPYLPIAHSLAFVAAARTVVGYRVDPLGLHDFSGVDLR